MSHVVSKLECIAGLLTMSWQINSVYFLLPACWQFRLSEVIQVRPAVSFPSATIVQVQIRISEEKTLPWGKRSSENYPFCKKNPKPNHEPYPGLFSGGFFCVGFLCD